MKRFTLKTPKFKGTEILYNQEGLLRRLDFNVVELPNEQIKQFKAHTAVRVKNIEVGYQGSGVVVEEAELQVRFDDFMR